ncbi:MAG: PCP reductase family protein [Nitrospirae bacterium]|nr:PCP reductase family protein [Nitrospirota bacterium]
MKFTCLKCNKEMAIRKSGDDLANISFSCPECGNGFGLAANEMESKVIRDLGLHLEMGYIPKDPTTFVKDALGADTQIKWEKDALERLSKIPEFVRDMAKKGIEKYASEKGVKMITTGIMDEVKEIYGM